MNHPIARQQLNTSLTADTKGSRRPGGSQRLFFAHIQAGPDSNKQSFSATRQIVRSRRATRFEVRTPCLLVAQSPLYTELDRKGHAGKTYFSRVFSLGLVGM